jgi:glycine cleavage system protein P-like pyridoxal-binding family
MATPRKRSTAGLTAKPAEETTEKEELEGFLDAMAMETFETIERQEEVKEEPKEEPKKEVIQEIVPTEDPGPRFVEQPIVQSGTPAPPAEPKKPRPHPRNIPRFTRLAK